MRGSPPFRKTLVKNSIAVGTWSFYDPDFKPPKRGGFEVDPTMYGLHQEAKRTVRHHRIITNPSMPPDIWSRFNPKDTVATIAEWRPFKNKASSRTMTPR